MARISRRCVICVVLGIRECGLDVLGKEPVDFGPVELTIGGQGDNLGIVAKRR